MRDHWKGATVFFLCCLVLFAIPAYGYIDPNAAGLASQFLTPLLLAAAAGLTFFRKQMGAAWTGLSRRLRRRSDA